MAARASRVLLVIGVIGVCAAPVLARQSESTGQDIVYASGNGVSSPQPIKQVDPVYTKAALKAKIEGTVRLGGVVEPDGSLGRLKILKSLDTVYGLDQSALDAAKQWKFEPGKKDGKPVPVQIELEMEFRLQR